MTCRSVRLETGSILTPARQTSSVLSSPLPGCKSDFGAAAAVLGGTTPGAAVWAEQDALPSAKGRTIVTASVNLRRKVKDRCDLGLVIGNRCEWFVLRQVACSQCVILLTNTFSLENREAT